MSQAIQSKFSFQIAISSFIFLVLLVLEVGVLELLGEASFLNAPQGDAVTLGLLLADLVITRTIRRKLGFRTMKEDVRKKASKQATEGS